MTAPLLAVPRLKRCSLAVALTLAMALAACSDSTPSPGASRAGELAEDLTDGPIDLAALVNPLIGTKNGETWPGADTPFGMVQWSPENTRGNQSRTPQPGGYAYDVTKLRGFSLTHLSGTGCAGAFGDIPFYPFPGEVTSSPSADSTDAIYASTFSHANEQARPGYYGVTLDSGVRAELTATTRTGSGRFTYPTDKPATLLLRTSSSELGSSDAQVHVDAASRTITGSVTSGNFCGYIFGADGNVDRRSYYTLYFRAEFDRPISKTGSWQDAALTPGSTDASGGTTYGTNGFPPAGKGSGAYVQFDTGGQPVNVRVGISFVSAKNAEENLRAENPRGTSFEAVQERAHRAWNREFNRVSVEGGATDDRIKFYTALYHALLHPNVFSDVNGEYPGFDQKPHRLSPGQHAQYANFSGWDVYRGQLQLVTLVEPQVGGDIAQSLLNQADQSGGVWDRWTHAAGGTHVMAGDPGHASVASIYAFGGTNFDARGALKSMVHAATTVTPEDLSQQGWNVMVVGERPSLDRYLTIHYVPAFDGTPQGGNAWGGAGETLEDVAADFGISQLAAKLGDQKTQQEFLARSGYWRNVFNPTALGSEGYMQDRAADGTFVGPFDPAGEDSFAEGSAAQYTFNVSFDPQGLFDAMGGTAHANARLDAFFHGANGNLAFTNAGGEHAEMNNEPSIGTPWLYNFAGAPYKSQNIVREVMNTLWRNTPDGIPGQDDLGAMSAWYVWSALGLYPQYPGRAELLLGSPIFTRTVVRRGNGVRFVIDSPAASNDARYVQGVAVNGRNTTRAWLQERFVREGGEIRVDLGAQPNTAWGADPKDAPPSFSAK